MCRSVMAFLVLSFLAMWPDRVNSQEVFAIGNATDDSNLVWVNGECSEDLDAKNRIIDLQDSPVRDIENAGDNQWEKYKNITEPKLPEGADYQEIYGKDGDTKKRFVYDWTKGKEKLYYTGDH